MRIRVRNRARARTKARKASAMFKVGVRQGQISIRSSGMLTVNVMVRVMLKFVFSVRFSLSLVSGFHMIGVE